MPPRSKFQMSASELKQLLADYNSVKLGYAMIQNARKRLNEDLIDIKKAADQKEIKPAEVRQAVTDVMQCFLNRVEAVFAGIRDENHPMYKEGIHWKTLQEQNPPPPINITPKSQRRK